MDTKYLSVTIIAIVFGVLILWLSIIGLIPYFSKDFANQSQSPVSS